MPKKVGLYLGLNSVAGVVSENKKIIALSYYDFKAVEGEAKIERLNEILRWEALINKVLQELAVTEKEVNVCLADKDFIFRSLELPLMRREELEASLGYEIARYIPFKIEELNWDYSYFVTREKKISLSFIGIKQGEFKKFEEIFSRLGLKIGVFEPASLSLVRVLKTNKNLSSLKNFILLDFTENEAYLNLFHNDLPIFSRFLSILKKDNKVDMERFIDALRLSLQYFRREFNFQGLERFIFLSSILEESLISFLKEEAQVELEIFNLNQFVEQPNVTLENLKAWGVAERERLPYRFKPLLQKRVKEREEILVTKPAPKVVPLNLGWLLLIFLIGGIILGLIFAFFAQDIAVEKAGIKLKEKQMVVHPGLEDLGWKEREKAYEELKKKVTALKNKEKEYKMVSGFFEKVPKFLPEGFWLERIDFNYRGGRLMANIRGNGFLGDANQESLALDRMIFSLRMDREITSLFSSIDLIFSERRSLGKFTVTSFEIRLE